MFWSCFMESFLEFVDKLSRADGISFEQFKKEVENAWRKYFPKSYCSVEFFGNIGKYLYIRCFLASDDRSEHRNGYLENDDFHFTFVIDLPKSYDLKRPLPDYLEAEVKSKIMYTKPKSRNLAYSHETVKLIKMKGTPEQIIKKLDGAFKKIHDKFKEILKAGDATEWAEALAKKKGY